MYRTLLPPNPTQGEQALEQVMGHASDQPIDIRTVKSADDCPLELLPWLAWEYAVTYWDENWTEAQKRSVIKSAPKVNKTRGTAGAVKHALEAVGRSIDVVEWFNDSPAGEPYTFRILVNGYAVTADELKLIAQQVADAKNARSYMSDIQIGQQSVAGNVYCGGACVVQQTIRIKAKRDE
jgi:phage tail P2-like protein